jgi:thiol:disulfide interchange protein
MTGRIKDGWYVYSSALDPNIGPIPTTVKFDKSAGFEKVGKLTDVGIHTKHDETWGADITYFTGTATLTQKVKVLKANPVIAGVVEFGTCSSKDGVCLPTAEGPFRVSVTSPPPVPMLTPATAKTASIPTKASPATTAVAATPNPTVVTESAAQTPAPVELAPALTGTADSGPESTGTMSLGGFALAAFLSGLLALLTPCVFPIIPLTVSFFTNQKGGIWKALLYGASIILIYVLIGVVVSRFNGPAFANFISTHWLPNLLFFSVFMLFALSFLGLFEIALPSSLVNNMDAQSEKGGLAGIFFMAFTLVLVSFSCTGPIVGSLLVASAGGEVLKPIVGMAAFSSAFAIPFTLFAIFPQALKKLPKSGGWLNSVKVFFGFIELALALKFLSIADQVYHWHLLNREIFLALWIVIFSMLGFYFLGKLRLAHDSKTETVGVPKLLLAIGTFAFVVYLIPGMWGAPLKALAGYLPPETSQEFNLTNESPAFTANLASSESTGIIKHADLFRLPHKLTGFFDYKQAMAYARKVNKPVFIDFTGHGCVNCREMEARVWADPMVLSRLRQDFVIVALYVDDKTELPETEWYTSTYDQKQKTSIGAQNADLQITRFNNNAQPYYVLLAPDGTPLLAPKNYDLNPAHFVEFLDKGKAAFATNTKLARR